MNEKKDFLKNWKEYPANPLICPPFPSFLLGDPSVLLPEESPDGAWHLFANTIFAIQHYTSCDGINWRRVGRVCPGMRAYVLREKQTHFLLCEEFEIPMFKSRIVIRSSTDLRNWSDKRILLKPELPWEKRLGHTCGNPCLVKNNGEYLLYYSAGLVFLPDLGFCEPLHVGVARASEISGPYEKRKEPIISPDPNEPYRNLGAGALKVIRLPGIEGFIGFNNGIYSDESGKTRSAILALLSEDGIKWEKIHEKPVISPGGRAWKRALVYQLDVKRVRDGLWLYYNARSGWRFGRECIGLATCPL